LLRAPLRVAYFNETASLAAASLQFSLTLRFATRIPSNHKQGKTLEIPLERVIKRKKKKEEEEEVA